MTTVTDLIVAYVITLKNQGITCVLPADISYYLHSIGVPKKKVVMGINQAIRRKQLIPLTSGKLSLNLCKK